MEIEKSCEKRAYQELYAFKITTDDGIFFISFEGNLDLYWYYSCKWEELKNKEKKCFRITETDGFFYKILLELYESVKNYQIYDYSDFSKEYIEDLKLRLMENDKHNTQKLLKNGKIDWHSDDGYYEDASRLLIELDNGDIIITFVKGITELERPTYTVRFRNSGSRYDPFNVCFMRMYNSLVENVKYLDEQNEEYHQISIKEYMLTRKKSQ